MLVQILAPWDLIAGTRAKEREERGEEEDDDERTSDAGAAAPIPPISPRFAATADSPGAARWRHRGQ
jgi:hypothetical protein